MRLLTRSLSAVLVATMLLSGCTQKDSNVAADDSVAGKAGAAAERARKKAEALKKAEDEKAKQTNDAMNDN